MAHPLRPGSLEHRQLREAVVKNGLESDPFVCLEVRPRAYGLNVALGWPLPSSLRENYLSLAAKLEALSPDLYVYRYSQTHVTVMTLVNFKLHVEPGQAERTSTDSLARHVAQTMRRLHQSWRPFVLDFTTVVMSRQAVFIPIGDEAGGVERIRKDIVTALEGDDLAMELQVSPAVHSTVARFRRVPSELVSFLRSFDEIALETNLGAVTVDEIVLTAETKPYMEEGHVIDRFSLSGNNKQ